MKIISLFPWNHATNETQGQRNILLRFVSEPPDGPLNFTKVLITEYTSVN